MYLSQRCILSIFCLTQTAWLIVGSEGKEEQQHTRTTSTDTDTRTTNPRKTQLSPHLTNSLHRQTQSRIVNGEVAPRDQYPWYTAFDYPGCGGSLITPEWVLTAAHCTDVNSMPPGYQGQVRINAYCGFNLTWINDLGVSNETYVLPNCTDDEATEVIGYGYEGIYLHPSWGFLETGALSYDYALVKLDSPSSTTPVEIDDGSLSPSYEDGKELWALGLGRLAFEGDVVPNELMHVDLSYINNEACNDIYMNGTEEYYEYGYSVIDDSMMCAGGNIGASGEDNGNVCSGDSGGALYDDENDVLVGITSWGIDCDLYPGVFARVAEVNDWIKQVVCFNSNDESTLPSWCEGVTKVPTASPTPKSTCNALTFGLELTTDAFPGDTTWDVTNSLGEVVLSSFDGKPIVESYTTYESYACLDLYECYNFTIYDSFGDGLTVVTDGFPEPGYTVYTGIGPTLDVIATYDGAFFDSQSTTFGDCTDSPASPTPGPTIGDRQVLCPGLDTADFCDCGYDCTGNPSFCACEEAVECCGGAVAPPTPAPTHREYTFPPSVQNTNVLCPGLDAADYCDCGYDCTGNPSFCGCEEAVECCGGEVAPPTPAPTMKPGDTFQIMSTFPLSTDWCVEAASMEIDSDIVVGECHDYEVNQKWTVDEYGRIQLNAMSYLCITKAPFSRLTLDYCGSTETSSESSFMYNEFENTILDMDASVCFTIASFFPEEGDDVILASRDRSLQVQEWIVV